jgi:hypothetical protein
MSQAFAGKVLIYDFSKNGSYKVQPAYIKTKAKHRGFRYAVKGHDARLWYKSASGRDVFCWSIKDIDIQGFDKLQLLYMANKNTYVTIDLWYDGKMVNPRLISYVNGTGKYETIKLPVRGKKLKMAISISETKAQGKAAPGEVREIFLKGLWGINSEPEQPKKLETSQCIIIPRPKEEKVGKEKYYLYKNNLNFYVETAGITSDSVIAALDTIAEDLHTKSGIALDKKKFFNSKNKNILIALVIGGKSTAAKALKVDTPNKPEGYTIKCGKYKGKNAVVVSGNDLSGLFWGIQTLVQLIKKDTSGVFIPECHIRDWPGFPYRSMGGGSISRIKDNLKAKINVHFSAAWDHKIKGKWNNPPKSYRDRITKLIKFCGPRGVQMNQWVEPYDRASKNNIICSDPGQVDAYYNTFKIGLDLGNRVITIGFDDQAREKGALSEKDRLKFGSDLKTHAWLLAEIAKRVKRDYPGTLICTVPKTYQSGVGHDIKGYYDNAGVPRSVVIMWTGESTVTLSYPGYKIKAFEKSIEGRRFVIFDNTFCQTLGEGRTLTLFETFGSGYKSLGKSSKCIGFHAMAGFSRSEARKIKAWQIADFLWNPGRFNPEISRSRAMAKVAGIKAVAPLLEFRYYMMKIAELFPVEKNVKKLSREFRKRTNISDDEYKKYQAIIVKAGTALAKAKKNSTNKILIKQLEQLLENSRKVLMFISKEKKKTLVVIPGGTVKFNVMEDIRGGRLFKRYAHKCAPKTGVAIYGNRANGNNIIKLDFILKQLPDNNACLVIEGQDDDKAGRTSIRIILNGNTIFEGKNTFKEKGWSDKLYSIPKRMFKEGHNSIVIENLEKSDSFASSWFMLSNLELQF